MSGVSGQSHEEVSNDTLLLNLLTFLVVSSNASNKKNVPHCV